MTGDLINLDLTINGKRVQREGVRANELLINFLHEDDSLGLTGTKFSCGIGACSSCKVAAQETPDGAMMPLLACYARLNAVNGLHLTTVEGVAPNGTLHPLQAAFLDHHAFQCGFSTPGFLMAAYILVDNLIRNPISPDQLDELILDTINGHVCRCTGYLRYFAAIREVICATPGTLLHAAPGPKAIIPSGVCFRLLKQSSNDLFEKPLIGYFEAPTGQAVFNGSLSLDTCQARLELSIASIRTGERIRDLNLRKFLFGAAPSVVCELKRASSMERRLRLDTVPQGTPVPLEILVVVGFAGMQIEVTTEVFLRILDQTTMRLTSRAPIVFDPRDLRLSVFEFAREFGLRLGSTIEVSLDFDLNYVVR